VARHKPSRHRQGAQTPPAPRKAIAAPVPPAVRVSEARHWVAALALLIVIPVAAVVGFGVFLAGAYGIGRAMPNNPIGGFFGGGLPLFGFLGSVLTCFAAVRGMQALGRWRLRRLARRSTALTGRVTNYTTGEVVNTRGPNRAYVTVSVTFTDVDGCRRVLRQRYSWWAYRDEVTVGMRERWGEMQVRRTPVTVYRGRFGGYGTDLPTDRLMLTWYW
jgi:hypothetical protein